MPSINDSRKIIKSNIPSIAGSEVEIWDSLTVGDAERIENANSTMNKGMMTFVCLVKSWNLDEECNEENLKKLSIEDMNHLIGLTSYGDKVKKTLEEQEDEKIEKKSV
jgi:hypothetical protein